MSLSRRQILAVGLTGANIYLLYQKQNTESFPKKMNPIITNVPIRLIIPEIKAEVPLVGVKSEPRFLKESETRFLIELIEM